MADIDRLPFKDNSNIGLFAGGKNGLVIIDADSDRSRDFVIEHLKETGFYPWTTIVLTPKRKGQHFWLRMSGIPSNAQAYYKLPQNVGGGELRVHRPAYVVGPHSIIKEGEYTFIQGSAEFFVQQPEIPWLWLSWLLPRERLMGSSVGLGMRPTGKPLAPPKKFKFRPDPHVLKILEQLRDGNDGGNVYKIDYRTGVESGDLFSSRSEAEFAVIMGLVMAGWTFNEIKEAFDDFSPGHYSDVVNPSGYLVRSYNNVIKILSR